MPNLAPHLAQICRHLVPGVIKGSHTGVVWMGDAPLWQSLRPHQVRACRWRQHVRRREHLDGCAAV